MNQRQLFVCAKCKIPVHENDVFKWSICNHAHCRRCITKIIDGSLSISNSLPQCNYPNCNQQLKLQDAQQLPTSLLSSKYKLPCESTNHQQCKKEEYLIFGSIRSIVKKLSNYKNIIPLAIISLIHDYYNLILVERVPCGSCLSVGYQLKKQKVIKKCTNCDNNGMRYINCHKCKGIGYTSFKTNCGSGYVDCFKVYCSTCTGSGKSKFTEKCTKCEYGFWSEWQMNKYDCKACKGQKYVMKLDFIKLRNKQILCLECRQYHPINKILYWSNCGHVYCLRCFEVYFLPLIKHQIYQKNKIPICPQTSCNQTFARNNIQIIDQLHNSYALTINKLKKMYGVKDAFKCRKCKKYSSNHELRECAHCNGKYCASCDVIICWKVCGHLSCLKCANGNVNICLGKKCASTATKYKIRFRCEMCKKVRCNRLFLWTNCKHTYCLNCVEDYFGKPRNLVQIEGNLIFYVRKKHLKHINLLLAAPVCFNRNCKQLLSIDDYKSIK